MKEDDEIEIVDEELEEYEAKHKESSEILLTLIARREELIGILKLAMPEKIAGIRKTISDLDKAIDATEEIISLYESIIRKKYEHIELLKKAYFMTEDVLQGMREHFADQPEKMEQIEAMLADDKKSH